MSTITDNNSSEVWSKHFDERYETFYYYNNYTGESQWECPTSVQEEPTTSSEVDNTRLLCAEIVGNEDSKRNSELSSGIAFSTDAISSCSDCTVPKDKGIYANSFNQRELTFEVVDTTNISETDIKPAQSVMHTHYDIVCYSRFLHVNAILFEAPFVVLEAFLRAAAVVVIAVVHFAWLTFQQRDNSSVWTTMVTYFREIVLTVAAALSLAVPGMIYCVYSNYNGDNCWSINAIPSIVGPIDPRRFAVITVFGIGALADNVHFEDLNNTRFSGLVERPNRNNYHTPNSLDYWAGDTVLMPRVMIIIMMQYLNGSY